MSDNKQNDRAESLGKSVRHSAILRLIEQEAIDTQEMLSDRLRHLGIKTTQATVSRDVKELGLTKEAAPDGTVRYTVAYHNKRGAMSRFTKIFGQVVLSIDKAQNIIVIKTLPGAAHTAGEVVDNLGMSEIVGSLAGDNTCLIIARRASNVPEIINRLNEMMQHNDDLDT